MVNRPFTRRRMLGMLAAPVVALPIRANAESDPFAWQGNTSSTNGWFEDYQPPARTSPAPSQPGPVQSPAVHTETGGHGVRRLVMANAHNHETIDVVYWRDGSYQANALTAINRFMRDWRDGVTLRMSERVIDFIYRTRAELGTTQPFILVSGARSQATNRMLIEQSRQRNGGVSQVATNSLHLFGRANDLRMNGHSVGTIASAARRVRGAGGVGRYTGSNFVHLDDGPYRTWGA